MLLLTRRVGERVIINKNIEVVMLGIKGNQIKLGFIAPDDVEINREEVQMRINLERESEANYGNK